MNQIKLNIVPGVFDPKYTVTLEQLKVIGIDVPYPKLYRMIDNTARVVWAKESTSISWLFSQDMYAIEADNSATRTEKPAPNPSFSESFILKLVAVSKDPNLIEKI